MVCWPLSMLARGSEEGDRRLITCLTWPFSFCTSSTFWSSTEATRTRPSRSSAKNVS